MWQGSRKAGIAVLAVTVMLGVARGAQAADVDAARKEGEVVYYSSAPREVIEPAVTEFQKKYGIAVTYVRKGSGGVIQTVEAERQAGVKKVDLVDNADPGAILRWKEQGYFARFEPADRGAFLKDLLDPTWESTPLFPIFQVIVYNTRQVRAEEAPKSWKDLTDPKWKGKLVHGDPNYSGNVTAMVNALVRLFGWDFYQQLAKNRPLMVQSITAVPRTVVTGEALVGAGSTDGDARVYVLKGEPLAIVYPKEGVFFVPLWAGIPKDAPHPSAARLLLSYLVSKEGQQHVVAGGYAPARTDVEPPRGTPALSSLKLHQADFQWLKAHKKEQNDKFFEIMK